MVCFFVYDEKFSGDTLVEFIHMGELVDSDEAVVNAFRVMDMAKGAAEFLAVFLRGADDFELHFVIWVCD